MRTLLPLAAALAFAAPALAQTPDQFVMKAGAGDLYEQQSSKLVLASTKDAKVKEIANMMIADHAKSTSMVKTAAKEAGLKPMPPKLEPKQATMVADLRRATGPARDTLYLQQQKMAHQEALALHQGYAATGSSAPLKAAAGQIVPVVQHHIEMLP